MPIKRHWIVSRNTRTGCVWHKEKIQVVYEGKQSRFFTREQAIESLKHHPSVNAENYWKVDELISNQQELLRQAAADYEQKQKALAESSATLATAEKVFGGTYVQHLVAEERERRETKYIPNGMKFANGGGV